ncbi:MAG: HAMP domain-containing histidine kinase [Bacteroidetes bacterium]|nr:HAMP domain-containing histidine kinase [Bacteroidota bacterium]
MPKAQNSSFELFPVIISNVDLYKETENININFIDLSSGACEVYADREQLIRVFSNLIKNAIQSIPPSRKGEITITLSQTNYDAIVKIEDNGTGMDEEVKARVFTPNFTTKSAGSGLGLAMVKNILESSGGKISFDSSPGVGTVFQVTLPLNKSNHE